MGSRRHSRWLLAPMGLLFVCFVLAPLVLLAVLSVSQDATLQQPGLDQYRRFLGDDFNRSILFDTLILAGAAVVAAIVLGYPVAYLYSRVARRWQRLLLFVVLLPLLTSAVVRTFAWVVILGRDGLINQLMLATGLAEVPLKLLYTPAAVVALAQIELPLMILPLAGALSAIDPRLREASLALGAGRWRTFWRVTLPLSVPGLLAGSVLVFAAAASAFVTQTLIGGGQLIYMPFYIYQQAIQSQDYPFAAAIALVLLVAVLAVVAVLTMLGRRSRGFIHD